ncbi:MAG: plasmid recombination protein, partial [Eggerthellaceae bacterium]|nr:plasmid recombination protein [Eggerthellaceae bacterium]
LGGLQHHHDREGNKHSNQDIDLTRSELNKHWIENGDYEVFVSKRIEEGRTSTKAVRKDAVVMVDGIVTLGEEDYKRLGHEKTIQYLEDAKDFVVGEFGEENMVHFTIHLDETVPHGHFGAVPLKDGSLAWKNYFPSKIAMSKFQDRFYEQVSRKYGLDRGEKRQKGQPVRRHKTVAEMKTQAAKELEQVKSEVEAETARLELLRQGAAEIQREIDRTEGEIKLEEESIRGIESGISTVEVENRRARSRIEELRGRIIEARSALVSKLQGLVARARSVGPALYAASSRALGVVLPAVETREKVPYLDEFKYDKVSGAYHATVGNDSFEIRPTGDGAYTWSSNVGGKATRKIVTGDAYAAWRDLNESYGGEKPSVTVPTKSKAPGATSVNKDKQQVSQPRISHQTNRLNRGFSR